MRRRQPMLAAVALAMILASACSSAGTVVDDGQASVPAEVDDLLTITSPEDGATVTTPVVSVTGTAPDGADVVRDVALGSDDHVAAKGGRWTMDVELDEGDNLLTFRVGADKTTAATLLVIYAPTAAASTAPSPADEPTPLPVAEPAPTAEPEPTDEPEPKPLSVKVTKRTASVLRNHTASVTIKTTKGSRCSIDVVYPSGSSTASGLGNKTANGSGLVTWKWKVGGNTTKGTHDIYVSCSKGDRVGSVDTTFRVR